MIRSISFRPDHYAYKLDCIGSRVFNFPNKPSLTFLYGPNGSGKSTIIKGLAAGSATKGGWSKPLDPMDYGVLSENREIKTVLGEKTEVDWDGTPSFFVDASVSDNSGSRIEVDDGVGDSFRSGVEKIALRPSSGQWRINRIIGMVAELNKKKYPDLSIPAFQQQNPAWKDAGLRFAKYIKTLDRTGIPTILLDEPDRSLSLTRSSELICDLLPSMAKDLQVIVATHSFFCLFVDGANVVDLQDGYAAETKSLLRRLTKEKK